MADTEDCMCLDRAPDVTKFIAGPWNDPDRHRAFIEHRTLGPYPDGQGYWIVRAKSDASRFLGWVLLIPRDAEGPETEIGWRLLPEAQGAGYATEAASALLGHAFADLKLNEVVADIHRENGASIRVAEKLGFKHVVDFTCDEADHIRYAAAAAERTRP